ncbi:MAG: hypothetical protein O2783_07345 [Chloroflexi bacterium]|nr:hypothetical protein [Chloroflexota bacterium]
MSEPEFQRGDMVWVVDGETEYLGPQLIGELGTIEAYVGTISDNDATFYLVNIDGTTYSLDQDWLEYA